MLITTTATAALAQTTHRPHLLPLKDRVTAALAGILVPALAGVGDAPQARAIATDAGDAAWEVFAADSDRVHDELQELRNGTADQLTAIRGLIAQGNHDEAFRKVIELLARFE